MIIYKITNKINGKVYIGQTVQDLKERWYGHCRAVSNCTAIARAMKKYGKENFTIEQIDKADNLEDLNKKEMKWIFKLNSMNRSIGYNLTTGGMNAIPSEETKQKMRGPRPHVSEKQKGRKLTLFTKAKMSQAHLGKVFSSTTREKLSKALTGIKRNKSTLKKLSDAHKKQPIRCIQTNQIYLSAVDAACDLKIKLGNIYEVLKKRRKTVGGFSFVYEVDNVQR